MRLSVRAEWVIRRSWLPLATMPASSCIQPIPIHLRAKNVAGPFGWLANETEYQRKERACSLTTTSALARRQRI